MNLTKFNFLIILLNFMYFSITESSFIEKIKTPNTKTIHRKLRQPNICEKKHRPVGSGKYYGEIYSLYSPYYCGYWDTAYTFGAPYGYVSAPRVSNGFGTNW